MRVSLLRFFKTFQTYLAYVFLGYLFHAIHYCDFLAYAFFGLLLHYCDFWPIFGQFLADFWPKNCSNEMNSPKIALAKHKYRSNEIKNPKTHKPNIFGKF